MSAETTIKTVQADSNSLYRVQKVRVSSSKHFNTPVKAVDLHRLKLKFSINDDGRGFNEIFKRFNAKQIKTYNEDSYSYKALQDEINTQKNRISNAEQVTACFMEFNENRMPNPEETEFLINAAYPHSDITPIPVVSYIYKAAEHKKNNQTANVLEDYKEYVVRAIESINELNHKPILGIIPKIAPKKICELVAIYKKYGVNAYAIDLDGTNPISAYGWTYGLVKLLKEQKVLENSFIHGYNMGKRVNKTVDVIPAKDILGFGTGLDSIGDKHKKFIANRGFIEMMKLPQENKFRLFNKQDYGYWKAIPLSELKEQYPKDTKINLDLFNSPKDKNFVQKLFNTEQLSLEAVNMRNIVMEAPEKSLNYIKSKKSVVSDDISLLERLPKRMKQ